MNKVLLIICLLVFIGISGYISGMFYVMVHEQAHAAVFSKYNIDSTIQLQPYMISGGTIPNEEQYKIQCNDVCKSDQLNIDAVGYHIALLIFALHLLSLMLFSFYILFINQNGIRSNT